MDDGCAALQPLEKLKRWKITMEMGKITLNYQWAMVSIAQGAAPVRNRVQLVYKSHFTMVYS